MSTERKLIVSLPLFLLILYPLGVINGLTLSILSLIVILFSLKYKLIFVVILEFSLIILLYFSFTLFEIIGDKPDIIKHEPIFESRVFSGYGSLNYVLIGSLNGQNIIEKIDKGKYYELRNCSNIEKEIKEYNIPIFSIFRDYNIKTYSYKCKL